MKELSELKSFAKGTPKEVKRTNNVVLYTRVSSKEQEDGYSLDVQIKANTEFARMHKYEIMSVFGGEYESAKTDERKEFNRMLEFIKKSNRNPKTKVTYIIVHKIDRFSRSGPNALYIKEQLNKNEVYILSTEQQPSDVHTLSGDFNQNMQILMAHNNNMLRRKDCMEGTKEALLQGYWVTNTPTGYDSVRRNGDRMLVINEKGHLIRKAFHWKAEEGISNEEIRKRLRRLGFKVSFQTLSKILKNPFYAGAMVHTALEGKVVEGRHEKLVSMELFLEVNGLSKKKGTYFNTNDRIPLKQFVKCAACGRYLRGYLVKKKKKYYYKCNTIGCNCNKNAEHLNGVFEAIAKRFTIEMPDELVQLIRTQMIATFNQLAEKQINNTAQMMKQLDEVKRKLNRLEERFIEEDISRELYEKYTLQYETEKNELQKELESGVCGVSNLEKCVDSAIAISRNLASAWKMADYETKQQIQFWLFPEGLEYDKKSEGCRTVRINSVFRLIACYKQELLNEKSGIPELSLEYSALVARRGVEPLFPG
jgi:site-specific DNA recombinase